ncbi:hypothetical protein SOVF_023300 [Spinacia oleracea]|uniref:AT hook motif-containing protein n=1 Tax=Spinacia oleracea TaxID=3562 RepID=A0A9R0HWX8_SPIOL|nr:uncharacterized protein LOC110778040 [Spinacia oleracea]KNA23630.1 hypothetical protein SOVF_023300 [Spinacia oleracea]
MSQLMNTPALPAEGPIKRKRGRPRKDERTPVSGLQGEGSGVLKPTENTPSKKGKESIEDVDVDDDDDEDDNNNDEMIGQVVTGILEYAFDAGYFLTVRVGDSNMCLRGIVFKEGCVVPVTPENDIAPNAKMYKRKEFPVKTGRDSLIPTQNNGNQQRKLPAETTVIQKEDENLLREGKSDDKEEQSQRLSDHKEQQERSSDDKEQKLSDDKEQEKLSDCKEQQEKLSDDKDQEKLSDDKEQQEKLSDDKEQHEKLSDDKEQHEKLSDDKEQPEKLSDDKEQPEKLSDDKEQQDLSEPPMKLQKTDQMTSTHSNVEEIVTFEDAVKSTEAENNTVSHKETPINQPEAAFSVKDSSSVDVQTVMEQEICRSSEFQISMDDEDELSEPPSDASPMAIDQIGGEE